MSGLLDYGKKQNQDYFGQYLNCDHSNDYFLKHDAFIHHLLKKTKNFVNENYEISPHINTQNVQIEKNVQIYIQLQLL